MPDEQTPLLAVVRVEPRRPRYQHSTLRRFCTFTLSGALILVLVCFLLPVAFLPDIRGSPSSYLPWAKSLPHQAWPSSDGMKYEELQRILLETPNEAEARKWSEYYTSGPHLAGKNLSQALWTKDRWVEFGVESSIVAYDIYINYPLDHRLVLLEVDSAGGDIEFAEKKHKIKYECSLEEVVLDEDYTTGLKDRIPTFHGYSASGNVTAPYVYVNFGSWQDFEDLLVANVSLKGKIAVAKYGHVFRGLKVKRAQELGMVGMVIYTDPQEDGNVTIVNGHKAYPDGPARNPSSVQRGSTQFISAAFQIVIS
jgi:N-acetylated-alpha-linked acidic dipeptidase